MKLVIIERICGLHGGDALQVASAKISGAKYFITRDEVILERAKCISKETGIFIINPKNFVEGGLRRCDERADGKEEKMRS